MSRRPTARGDERPTAAAGGRGQSSVVGVALLLGATVIALGVLTASVGALVDSHVARTDASRVATELEETLRPLETTGHDTGRISFTEGSLHTVERDLRVFDSTGLVARVSVGALVYEHGERRAAFLAGAVVRGRAENAWLVRDPPVTTGSNAVVVGAPTLGTGTTSLGGSQVTARIETNVTHSRRRLPTGRYRVALETTTPRPFARYFRGQGATVSRRDIDGDGVESVVAAYPSGRTVFLVEHAMRLEVSRA